MSIHFDPRLELAAEDGEAASLAELAPGWQLPWQGDRLLRTFSFRDSAACNRFGVAALAASRERDVPFTSHPQRWRMRVAVVLAGEVPSEREMDLARELERLAEQEGA